MTPEEIKAHYDSLEPPPDTKLAKLRRKIAETVLGTELDCIPTDTNEHADPVVIDDDDISVLREIARGRTQPGDNITPDEARKFLRRLRPPCDLCRDTDHTTAQHQAERDRQAEAHHSCDPGPREACWHTKNHTEGHDICPCDCHDEDDNPPDYTIHSTV
jgi:hypothetical protein